MENVTTHLIAFDMSGWAMWHARYTSYVKKLVMIVQDQCVNAPGHTRSFDRTALGKSPVTRAMLRPRAVPSCSLPEPRHDESSGTVGVAGCTLCRYPDL